MHHYKTYCYEHIDYFTYFCQLLFSFMSTSHQILSAYLHNVTVLILPIILYLSWIYNSGNVIRQRVRKYECYLVSQLTSPYTSILLSDINTHSIIGAIKKSTSIYHELLSYFFKLTSL